MIFFFPFSFLWRSYRQSIVCCSTSMIVHIFSSFSCWFLALFNHSQKIRNHLIFFVFVKTFLCPIIGPVTETVPWFSEKNVYSSVFEWNVLHMSVGSIWSVILFNSDVSLFIFWWNFYWWKWNVEVTYIIMLRLICASPSSILFMGLCVGLIFLLNFSFPIFQFFQISISLLNSTFISCINCLI